jgi:hypothetical protein
LFPEFQEEPHLQLTSNKRGQDKIFKRHFRPTAAAACLRRRPLHARGYRQALRLSIRTALSASAVECQGRGVALVSKSETPRRRTAEVTGRDGTVYDPDQPR